MYTIFWCYKAVDAEMPMVAASEDGLGWWCVLPSSNKKNQTKSPEPVVAVL